MAAQEPPTTRNGVPGILHMLKGDSGEFTVPFTGKGQMGLFDEPGTAPEDDTPGPVWLSKAEETIKEKVPNNASADQVTSTLKSAGVKPDEMAATGLDDFLKS